jgi:hypothetical protein
VYLPGVNKILTYIATQKIIRLTGVRVDVVFWIQYSLPAARVQHKADKTKKTKIWFVLEVSVNNRDERQWLKCACAKCVCTLHTTPFFFAFVYHTSRFRNCFYSYHEMSAPLKSTKGLTVLEIGIIILNKLVSYLKSIVKRCYNI